MANPVNTQKHPRIRIVATKDLDVTSLERMRADAAQFGFKFVDRLCDEWSSGANRFDRMSEGLFLAFDDDEVVGVCGINRDPYAEDLRVGRVRRLYVLSTYRGRGVGRTLLDRVIENACGHFDLLRVRTDYANDFYLARGFRPVDDDAHATHEFVLSAMSLEGILRYFTGN